MKHFALLFLTFSFSTLVAFGQGIIPTPGTKTPNPTKPTLTVSPASLEFPAAGGSKTITVNASSGKWSTTETPKWLKLSTQGNTITVTVGNNNGTSKRKTYFSVHSGNLSQTVHITQKAATKPAPDTKKKEVEKQKQLVFNALEANDCDSAQKYYDQLVVLTKQNDPEIDSLIAQCKRKKDIKIVANCQYINLGEYVYKRVQYSKDINYDDAILLIKNEHPSLQKYYFLYDQYSGSVSDFDTIVEGKLRPARPRFRGWCSTDKGGGKYEVYATISLSTPDHRRNLKNLLTLSLRDIKKGESFVIKEIVLPQGKDYLNERDYEDLISSYLLDSGYRFFTTNSPNKAKYGIVVRLENESMRLQIINVASGELVSSEIMNFKVD